jgi:hypothetical protein
MRTKFKFLAVVVAMIAALLPVQPSAAAGYAYLYGGNSVGDIISVQVNDVPQNADLQYTWTLDGSPIDGATDLTYTPNDSEIGHFLAVVVTFTLPNYPAVYIVTDPIVVTEGASGPGGGGGGPGDNGGGDNGGGGGGGPEILDPPLVACVGYPTVDETLTADITDWPAGIDLTYLWLRDGEAIDGATDATYVLTVDDAGHAITVAVTGSPDGINELTGTSEAVDVGLADLTLTPTPEMTGTLKVGKTLTANTGTWDDGVEFSYQWYIDNDAVDGATEETFVLPAAAVDLLVFVEVTGSKLGYNPSVQASEAGTVALGTLVKTPVPTLSGTFKVGQRLTANEKTWDDDVTFEYQWLASGKVIADATEKTFTLTAAQLGKTITVKVTGSLEGYVSVTKASVASAKVAVGAMTVFATPTIVGAVKAGKAVTAAPGVWVAGAKFTYVWLLDGKAIKGAKAAKLTIAKTAKGHKLSVSVTATATGYLPLTKVSKVVKVG